MKLFFFSNLQETFSQNKNYVIKSFNCLPKAINIDNYVKGLHTHMIKKKKIKLFNHNLRMINNLFLNFDLKKKSQN